MLPAAVAWGQRPEPVTVVAPVSSPGPSMAAAPPPAAAISVVSPPASAFATPLPPVGELTPDTAASPTPAPGSPPAPPVVIQTPAPSPTPIPAVSTPAPAPAPVPNAPVPYIPPQPHYSIEIDLTHQRAYLLEDGHELAECPISSGRAGHLTPTGNFEVIQKDLNHFSNLYGKIVEKDSGRLVKAGADVAMPVPKGCMFVPAPMKWFMRFDGASGMHAGILPGYPASHGCVRMPASMAELFYATVDVGTPVHVFGIAPVREEDNTARRLGQASPKSTAKPHHFLWF
jgi:lipoprotein-anchoring transpeptidase ErfK/SrfK